MANSRIVIFASGGGSNFQSIAESTMNGVGNARVSALVTDRSDAGVRERAKALGIPTHVVDFSSYEKRTDFDQALYEVTEELSPDVIALAGFMRILAADFVNRWDDRMLNIHPALLPRYRGLDTHARALEDGATEHGATVHFVVPELDAGPIIIQARLDVRPEDDVASLQRRVIAMEHIIYPRAIDWFVQGRLSVVGDRVLLDGVASDQQWPHESDIRPTEGNKPCDLG